MNREFGFRSRRERALRPRSNREAERIQTRSCGRGRPVGGSLPYLAVWSSAGRSRIARSAFLLVLICVAQTTRLSAAEVGALSNPTGRPIGGGDGYGAWVSPSGAQTVATLSELRTALALAGTSAPTVYVADDAVIDLGSGWVTNPIEVPAGVTLASGRGRGSAGALLYTKTGSYGPVFRIRGQGSRITGLRLRGPDTRIDPGTCGRDDVTGIQIEGVDATSVVVDNNEMWGWTHTPVRVLNGASAHVHHNHIHHNRRDMPRTECPEGAYGLGYGVRVDVGFGLIEANLFDHNRHDVASDGRPGANYEARYNLVLHGGVDQSFDVHGGEDRDKEQNPVVDVTAGTVIEIHHNTVLQSDTPAVMIRGIPEVRAVVSENEFRHSAEAKAILQKHGSQGSAIVPWQKLTAVGNRYAVEYFPAWFASFGGDSFWRWRRFDALPMPAVRFADVDGDGAADALSQNKSEWLVSRGARLPWEHLNDSSVPLKKLAFGDFDGDGRVDFLWRGRVSALTPPHWYVSWSGVSAWVQLNPSQLPISKVALADFDGDGTTDVFYADGSRWLVSWRGATDWEVINHSTFRTKDLRVADLNGDGIADVIRADGAHWYVAWGGRGTWSVLNTSGIGLKSLAFHDFDGDGAADVFYANGSTWSVSWGGTTKWEQINASSLRPSSLAFADVDGDRRTDVVSRQ